MTTESPKFCSDCALYSRGDAALYDLCLKPKAMTGADLVRRDVTTKRYCHLERMCTDTDSCGVNANWFEPKSATEDTETSQ